MSIYENWVAVKERLPEPGVIVNLAIRTTNGNYGDGSWHIGSGHLFPHSKSWCCYYGCIPVEHSYPLPMPSVTHWLPLPPPPNSESCGVGEHISQHDKVQNEKTGS